MSNQWFRLYAEFATDPKVQMLPEAMQRRFIMLLCLRCNGDVTLQDSEVTFLLRISNDEWQETKALFIAKNFIDEANNIIHWDKRQFRSDSSKERVSRHREKLKQQCNVTVTPPDTDTDTDTDTDKKESKSLVHAAKKLRGTRLPPDWELSDEEGEWAEKEFHLPAKEIILEAEKFKDYWHARAGPGGVKLNWEATWRNWIRKVMEGKNNGIQGQKRFG